MIRRTPCFLVSRRYSAPRTLFRLLSCLALLTLLATGGVFPLMQPCAANPIQRQAAVVARCRKDLAQRLKLPVAEIECIDVQTRVWSDAALGLPKPGKVYARKPTRGWRVVLQARRTQYLYTANEHAVRFGGPLALWNDSMLFLRPVPNEPNLNGDLYQCSLLGGNPIRLVSGVSSYSPQTNGTVLFTRRTSRSGYDLLSAKAGKDFKPQLLFRAFYIGDAALNAAQDTWAAFVRPRLGTYNRNVVATIHGLTLRGYDLTETGYAFIWGEREGRTATCMVQIATGDVVPGHQGDGRDIQLFRCPPLTRP